MKPELKNLEKSVLGKWERWKTPNKLEVLLLPTFIILVQVLHYVELSLNALLPGILWLSER